MAPSRCECAASHTWVYCSHVTRQSSQRSLGSRFAAGGGGGGVVGDGVVKLWLVTQLCWVTARRTTEVRCLFTTEVAHKTYKGPARRLGRPDSVFTAWTIPSLPPPAGPDESLTACVSGRPVRVQHRACLTVYRVQPRVLLKMTDGLIKPSCIKC